MNTMRSACGRWKGCAWIGGVVLTAWLSGCSSGGPYPVEGQVVWKDGSPAKELAGSQVVFEIAEKQTSARGIVQADGSFHLSTNKPDDGALAGDHKVAIIETRKQQGGPDSSNIAPGAMDPRFYDLKTSGLSATVKPGTNKIMLTVERIQRR
jgi:hypothetical protein